MRGNGRPSLILPSPFNSTLSPSYQTQLSCILVAVVIFCKSFWFFLVTKRKIKLNTLCLLLYYSQIRLIRLYQPKTDCLYFYHPYGWVAFEVKLRTHAVLFCVFKVFIYGQKLVSPLLPFFIFGIFCLILVLIVTVNIAILMDSSVYSL